MQVEIGRRSFLSMIGLAGFKVPNSDHKDLQADVIERICRESLEFRKDKPYGVFIYATEKMNWSEIISVCWGEPNALISLDFEFVSTLYKDKGINHHFRLVSRLADKISERMGCKFGWKVDGECPEQFPPGI